MRDIENPMYLADLEDGMTAEEKGLTYLEALAAPQLAILSARLTEASGYVSSPEENGWKDNAFGAVRDALYLADGMVFASAQEEGAQAEHAQARKVAKQCRRVMDILSSLGGAEHYNNADIQQFLTSAEIAALRLRQIVAKG